MKWSNGPRQLHNFPSSSKVNWDKYKSKGYLHFDERVNIGHMKANILNDGWVASYAFLPYIHFEINFNKYVTVKEIDSQGNISKKKEKKKK